MVVARFPGGGIMSILHKKSACLGLMLVLLSVASCGKDHVTRSNPPVIGDDIVFSTVRSGLVDLYSMNADGSGLHRLTSDTLQDLLPRWSPDGAKIAFVHGYGHPSQSPESASVTVMNADGTGRMRLTLDRFDANPSWSPDGTQIAYQRDLAYDLIELWVVGADGSSPHLVISSDSLNGVRGLTWTTQNTFLGFDWYGIVQFNADGNGRTRLVSLTWVKEGDPRLSPDESKIAFAWGGPTDTGLLYIYVVNVDGSNLKQLTTTGREARPVWSPDGSKIAYLGEGFSWWTMNADGTNQKQLPLQDPMREMDLSGDWK
jgi:Tol biopolymer transport system component